MKLVVLINSLGLGGTEKAAGRWARGLQARGHAVTVLTLAAPNWKRLKFRCERWRRKRRSWRKPCAIWDRK